MRFLGIVALFTIGALAIACDGGGSPPPTATPTPEPSATPTPEPSALEILRRSDEAMNQLCSLRVRSEIRPTVAAELNLPSVRFDEYVAPDRAHYATHSEQDELQYEAIQIRGDLWTRTGLGGWQYQRINVPLAWPRYDRAAPRAGPPSPNGVDRGPLENLRLVGQEKLGGATAWVVSYSYQAPSTEGPFDVFVTEWIAEDTYLLLRQRQRDNDPFGVQPQVTADYYDFDAPITIDPPTAG